MAIETILATAALAYAGIVGLVYAKQESLLFSPDRLRRHPHDVGLSNVEVISLATPDKERLVAWYTPATAGKPTILFLHGKGGSIADRPERYEFYVSRGYGVLFLSYRGYGGSTGRPSEQGLMTDARAAYDWLVAAAVPPALIGVVGESLGTGIAAGLAARVPIGALALEAPYVSMTAVAKTRYWWLPVDMLIRNPIHAGAAIRNYRGPVLMFHGDRDTIIPLPIGRRLYEMANEPKEFVLVPGGDHFIFTEDTFAHELVFFDRHLGHLPADQ